MVKKHASGKGKKARSKQQNKQRAESKTSSVGSKLADVSDLQNQIGNQRVQQMPAGKRLGGVIQHIERQKETVTIGMTAYLSVAEYRLTATHIL